MLLGRYKCCIYQHAILLCVLWLLMTYKVTIKTVNGLERKIGIIIRVYTFKFTGEKI